MSADEFWHGDFELSKAYREAETIRRDNYAVDEWRSGVYIVEAMLTASPAFREISKGTQHQYPERPLFLSDRDDDEFEYSAMLSAKAHFESYVVSHNMALQAKEATAAD